MQERWLAFDGTAAALAGPLARRDGRGERTFSGGKRTRSSRMANSAGVSRPSLPDVPADGRACID